MPKAIVKSARNHFNGTITDVPFELHTISRLTSYSLFKIDKTIQLSTMDRFKMEFSHFGMLDYLMK